jgi:hypothetical protein
MVKESNITEYEGSGICSKCGNLMDPIENIWAEAFNPVGLCNNCRNAHTKANMKDRL